MVEIVIPPVPSTEFSSDIEEEKRNALRRVRAELRRAKKLFRLMSLFSNERKNPRLERSVTMTSKSQLTLPSSVYDSLPGDVQREEKDLPAIPPSAKGDELKSAVTKDVEETTTESEEIEKLRRELSISYSQIADLRKRCEVQSRDLECSNNFLNVTDKSSDSDVINAVQRLNAEVQQSTTYMADCLAEDSEFKNVTTNATKEQAVAVQRASGTIGQILAKSLGAKTPENIPMLLQIAFQAYLASILGQTASSWVFQPEHNAFINSIYQSLHGLGENKTLEYVPCSS